MLFKPTGLDGRLSRSLAQGDTFAAMERIQLLTTTQLGTLVAANVLGPILKTTASGVALAVTMPSAADIIAGISSGSGNVGIQNGTSWRLKIMNATAVTTDVMTLTGTAHTGVTVTHPTVNTASAKDFLITVTNGTPVKTVASTTTSSSAVITGMSAADTSALSVGMVVTNSVAGLQDATIISIQPGVGVTMSTTANATASNSAITFSPVVTAVGVGQSLI